LYFKIEAVFYFSALRNTLNLNAVAKLCQLSQKLNKHKNHRKIAIEIKSQTFINT